MTETPTRIETQSPPTIENIQKTIDTLPLAAPIKSCLLLYNLFNTLLESTENAAEKLNSIEACQSTVETLCDILSTQIASIPPWTALQNKPLRQHLINLPYRYASLFASLLCDIHPNERKIAEKSVFFALFYLAKTQSFSYMLYQSLPIEFWLRSHALYSYMEKNKLQGKNDVPYQGINDGITLYKIICLYGTVISYQFSKNELSHLQNYVQNNAQKIDIAHNTTGSVFILILTKDQGPRYFSLYRKSIREDDPQYCRGLQLNKLVEYTQSLLKQNPKESTLLQKNKEKIEPQILEKILLSWIGARPRRSLREEKKGSIQGCIGMNAIHFFLKNPLDLENNTANFNNLSTVTEDKHFDHAAEKDMALALDPWSTQGAKKLNPPQTENSLHSFNYKNVSGQGICLQAHKKEVPQCQHGSLIALIQTDFTTNACPWRLGSVKWLQATDDNHVLFGIHLLSDQLPILACTLSNLDDETHYDAIYIPEQIDVPASVLLQTQQDLLNKKFKIFLENDTINARLKEILLKTAYFVQYAL